MSSSDQVDQLNAENCRLRAKLDELSSILLEREEEIRVIRRGNDRRAELQSRIEMQLLEFHSMQNHIGELEQRVEGAVEREEGVKGELQSALEIRKEYEELLQFHILLQARYEDIRKESSEWQVSARGWEEKAAKRGELESELALVILERDRLSARLADLEKINFKPNLTDEI